jgi:hypothetical protein
MALTVRVEVFGKDVENSSFSVATTATNLNRNGATLHLSRDLPVDSVILIKNSRGARIPARVASETPMPGNQFAYGVEFLETDSAQDFWGINFPAVPSSFATRPLAHPICISLPPLPFSNLLNETKKPIGD